jgi:hypothetical protein
MRRSFAFWQLLFSLGLAAAGCSGSNDCVQGTFDGSCTTTYGAYTVCREDYQSRAVWMEQQCSRSPTSTTNICVATASICESNEGGTVTKCADSFLCDNPAIPVCCTITNTSDDSGSSATYSTGHCSTAGLSGKCTTLSGSVEFYYSVSGATLATKQATCTTDGGTWSTS